MSASFFGFIGFAANGVILGVLASERKIKDGRNERNNSFQPSYFFFKFFYIFFIDQT